MFHYQTLNAMSKVTANFENQTVYVGLDVHKRSWNAAIFLGNPYLRNIHQPPSPQALHHFLATHYPGARYACAYESGKFGFWIQRHFKQMGIECLVVILQTYPALIKMKCTRPTAVMPVVLATRSAAGN